MLRNRSLLITSATVVAFAFLSSGCRQDMHDNPRYEVYEEGSNRQPPEGTVARGSLGLNPPAPKTGTAQKAAQQTQTASVPSSNPAAAAGGATAQAVPTGEDGFPFKITKEILDRGESRFNISCSPCHSKLGDGNGMIALRGFRHPPSYHEQRLRNAPSSHFYDVVTNGFGAMPSYADQLTPEDRWKVIAWIRVLQLSQAVKAGDLAEVDRKKLEEAEQKSKEKQGSHSGGHGN